MNTQESLTSVPARDWVIDQVVVFDWYDGPREGVARIAKPDCEIAFELLAERSNPEGLDDRLFRLRELPPGSVRQILDALKPLGNPVHPVWAPSWIFASKEEEIGVEEQIDRVLSKQQETGIVMHSQNMREILGCWQAEPINGQVVDWFSTLSIH